MSASPEHRKLIVRRAIPFVILGVLLTGACVGLLIYGSAGKEGAGARKVYFVDNISPVHQLVIDRFNAAHRGSIEVVPVNLPFQKFSTNERKELLARALRTKSDRIDVFAVDLIWVPRFSKWGEPLDRFYSSDGRKVFLDRALESCSYDSVLVATPFYMDIGMMYYRRDILSRLSDADRWGAKLRNSVTWEEFLELRDRLKLKGRPYYVFQGDAFEGLVCSYFELLEGRERGFFRHNAIDLNSRVAHEALQQMVDFIYKEKISPPQVADFDEQRCYTYMLDHDVMFTRGWPNFVESFRRTYNDTTKLNEIGRAALPHLAGRPPVSVFGGWNLIIAKNSTNKEASLEFIRFLQSEETQKTLFELGGYIPINERVYDDGEFMRLHPDLAFYRSLLNNGFHRPALEEYTRISDVISRYVNLALKGELSVDKALEQASREMRSDEAPIR